MKEDLRKIFNEQVTTATYDKFIQILKNQFPNQLDFRIAESPIFVDLELGNKLKSASENIISQLTPAVLEASVKAIPKEFYLKNENKHTSFFAIDFALTKDSNGKISPQLIELQGFPSLFGFQSILGKTFSEQYQIPSNYSQFFNGLNFDTYVNTFKKFILGAQKPEDVILLEIFPETQKTRLDFAITNELFGIDTVCLTKIKQINNQLFREKDGKLIQIKRIYNRLIFDDLGNFSDLKFEVDFQSELDVEWVGHPNWFYKISKYSLPFLNSEYVPKSYFLNEFDIENEKVENFVLKPLFSFAGSGVKLNVTKEEIMQIEDKENYLMQRKVVYHPVIPSPTGNVKAEVRMLYIWPDDEPKPILITNLARLSRGEMIGVRFNKDFDWVGGSVCFFEN